MYDVDGRCLETPGEPAGSRLRERIWQGAYPTHEFAGLVFAYLGPPDRRPAFPVYDSYDVAGHQLMPAAKFVLPCNWLQVKDNSMDPVHTAFLHALSSGYQFTEAFGAVPELDWKLTDAGMVYLATRRVGDLVWVRVCDYMPPNIHQFTREIEEANEPKAASRPVIIRWAVPNDDTHTTNFELAQVDPAWGLTPEQVGRPGFGQSDDRPYDERQRFPADFDAQSSQRHDRGPRARESRVDRPRRDHAPAHRARRHPRGGPRPRPDGTRRPEGKTIPTFTQDVVLRVPPAASAEADRKLLRTTARSVIANGRR